MKEETKKLIKWIKNQLMYSPVLEKENDIKMRSALNLLDSLENIENQLKNGGFIPDVNGTPCKDGDKVRITRLYYDYIYTGKRTPGTGDCWTLSWNHFLRKFEIVFEERDKDTVRYEFGNFEFEKVE